MVLVDKLFGRLSSFSFQLKCSSIIFKFDLPLSVRKEPLITGSVILLISQSIDSMQLKCKGCLPPIGNNKQCCLSIKGFIGKYGTRNILWKIFLYRPNIKYLISALIYYFEEKKMRFLGEGRLIEGATYWETINLHWFRCSWRLKSYK